MNTYDSIERGVVDEGERRRPRTFTLTQLLVACVAVCVCSIAATAAVHRLSQEEPPDIEPRPDPPEPLDEPFRKAATTVVNTHQGPSRLANFDSGSAFDDDSALANFDDDSNLFHGKGTFPQWDGTKKGLGVAFRILSDFGQQSLGRLAFSSRMLFPPTSAKCVYVCL